jgi:predicted SprT family Zn-dependent metalloprotease
MKENNNSILERKIALFVIKRLLLTYDLIKQHKFNCIEALLKYEKITNEMLVKHNLTDWKFVLNNKMTNATFGMCKYAPKEIHLNKKASLILKEDEVINTIIHEIAHALTKGHDHDEVWKAKCRELGCRDYKYANIEKEVLNKLAKYKGICPTCGHIIYSGKKSGIIHVECSNEDYRQTGNSNWKNHKYVWSTND